MAPTERTFLEEPTDALVSVIVPSYNSASTLPDAIQSILNQTRPADEIIVVDDGSKDDTAEVCRAYAPAVTYLRQANRGASSARNAGIRASGGYWLAFLDADDLWEPRKLELQLATLAQNPDAAFALTPVRVWSPQKEEYCLYNWRGSLDPKVMRSELLIRNIFTGLCSSIVIRRDAIDDVGGFADGKACEDRRLAVELLARHRAVLLDEPLVRQRPGPAHWTNPERHRGEMLRFLEDYTNLYHSMDKTGLLRRRALARIHERSGMHYLENGDYPEALRDLGRAVGYWPFQPNPWRVLVNACLGRLQRPRQIA